VDTSVTLPFHSFSGGSETPSVADQQKPVSDPASTSALDEIIMLDTDTGAEEDVVTE
jgi:exosome complex exonuclease RRP6